MRMQCEHVSLFVQQCRHRRSIARFARGLRLCFCRWRVERGFKEGWHATPATPHVFSLDLTFAEPFQLLTSQKQITQLAHQREECSNRMESLRREDVDVKTHIVNDHLRGAQNMAEFVRYKMQRIKSE